MLIGRSATGGMLDGDRDEDRRFALLMRSAQDGDAAAYRKLLDQLTPLLRRLIRREQPVLHWHNAENLVQDILLALHHVRATYILKRPFLPWLLAIAHNRMAVSARHDARGGASEVTAGAPA